jgi:hypothetical protein
MEAEQRGHTGREKCAGERPQKRSLERKLVLPLISSCPPGSKPARRELGGGFLVPERDADALSAKLGS